MQAISQLPLVEIVEDIPPPLKLEPNLEAVQLMIEVSIPPQEQVVEAHSPIDIIQGALGSLDLEGAELVIV